MVKYDKKVWMDGVEYLEDRINCKYIPRNGNVRLCTVGKKYKTYFDYTTCHARLSYIHEYDTDFIISGVGKSTVNKRKADEFYLHWLLNDSPMASIFVEKNAHACLHKHKAVIATTDAPANLVGAGLVSSRRVHEFEHMPPLFQKMCKAGIHPNLAFFFMYCISEKDGSSGFYYRDTEHYSFHPKGTDRQGLLNLLEGHIPPRNLKKNIRKNEDYRGYSWIYNESLSRKTKECAFTWIVDNFKIKKTTEVTSINPFIKAKNVNTNNATKYYDNKIFYKQLAEFCNNELLDWLNSGD